jgi:hypothetical protein
MNGTQIGEQEVVYQLLNIPVSVSSRASVFINTAPPEKRVRLIKSAKELEEMDPDSTDIMISVLIEHYV